MAGLIDRTLASVGLQRVQRRAVSAPTAKWLQELLGRGMPAMSGVTVSESTVLSVAAVYACVKVLAESMASLPLHLYRRRPDGGRDRVLDHPIVPLLTQAPNQFMTAFEWREMMMGHLALRGNAYAAIASVGGDVVGLYPMHPDRVEVIDRGGRLAYQWQREGGGVDVFDMRDVLHIKGLSPNGKIGYSPLDVARQTFGHAIAVQNFGSQFFGNGSRLSGVLKHPTELDDEAYERLKANWLTSHGGDNMLSIAILEEGMEWQQLGVNPDDAQFLETTKFDRSQIAGLFKVPPHMIGDLERATFSNIEHQDLAFAKHTLVPWCERIEQAAMMRLLTADERRAGLYLEHNLNGIMRGDVKSRYEAYGLLWDRGIINANEIRALENMNPADDGDTYYVPLNFVPVGAAVPAAAPADADRSSRAAEHRARLSTIRHNVARSYRGVLNDALRRVALRDVDKVMKIAKQELRETRDTETFVAMLMEYFNSTEHTEYAERQLRPVFEAFAEALGPAAMAEIEREWEFSPPLRAWVTAYVRTFIERYQTLTREQLIDLIEDTEPSEQLAAIEGRVGEWLEGSAAGTTRPERFAEQESTRFGGAFVRTVFAGAGVTYLVWRSMGDSCPLCSGLDGARVGIESPFVSGGQTVGPDDHSMVASRDVMHPPLHAGCDCVIIPGG